MVRRRSDAILSDRRNGSMHRLLSLSAVIGSAIVASVTVAHAGTPPIQVPEPSAIALLGVGAAAFAWWQIGRKK
jgi:hypothetical protein